MVFAFRALALGLLAALAASPAHAVKTDRSTGAEDGCAVSLGGDVVSISGYQPNAAAEKYCTAFPMVGRSIITFDFDAPGLRDSSIGLRVVKGPNDDVEAEAPARFYRNGTFVFEHEFREAGRYALLLSATTPSGIGKDARFDFIVEDGWRRALPFALSVVLLGGAVLVYSRHSAALRPAGERKKPSMPPPRPPAQRP